MTVIIPDLISEDNRLFHQLKKSIKDDGLAVLFLLPTRVAAE